MPSTSCNVLLSRAASQQLPCPKLTQRPPEQVMDKVVQAVEKKETAPMEREAADGRPMWGGDKDEDEGAKEP